MRSSHQKGSLKWILIIIVALVLASYFFDFDVQNAVEDPQTQSNFSYIGGKLNDLWVNHLQGPAEYLWNDVFIDLLWESFTENLERIKAGQQTEFNIPLPVNVADIVTTG